MPSRDRRDLSRQNKPGGLNMEKKNNGVMTLVGLLIAVILISGLI